MIARRAARGASRTEKAAGRAEKASAAIEEALVNGNHQQALNLALRALQGEASKLRRHRPADGAVTDAELAGSISGIAAQLHAHTPVTGSGNGSPGVADLLAAYRAGNEKAGREVSRGAA